MTIPRRQRLLGIAALACAGFFLADRFVLLPLRDWHRTRHQEITQLSSEIDNAERLIELRRGLAERIDDYSARQVSASPSQAEHELLASLRRWAGRNGVSIESIRPRRLQDREQLSQLELRVVAKGNMEAVARLIYDLETEARPLRIRKVDLSGPRNGSRQLGVSLTIMMLLAQTETILGESES